MDKLKEDNKGITLIALVITIILLLILSAATINVIFSADGLFSKAVASKEEYKRSEVKDVISLAKVYVKEE